MTLTAWRIVKRKHQSEAFTGEGARLHGGRWNGRGVPVVYTAQHASLAVLELLVHLRSDELLREYLLYRLRFEEPLVESVAVESLPSTWRGYPAPAALSGIGDEWAEQARSAVLSVPSAIVPVERLYLLNPAHGDFGKIQIGEPEPLLIDSRLATG